MPLQPIPIEAEPAPDSGGFELQLDVFSGPLELLLRLIESRELDVLTVSLAEMADAYVAHLTSHPVAPAQLADFIAIASRLILLKSRRLLPGEPDPVASPEADEPNEEELRRRLIEYRALRDAARALAERDGTLAVFRREPRESDLPAVAGEQLAPSLLAAALERLAEIPEPEAPPPEVVPREVTIAMQLTALRAAMAGRGRVVLQEVLATCESRTQVTVTMLAMLELVRRRQARIEQHELFGPILIESIADGGEA